MTVNSTSHYIKDCILQDDGRFTIVYNDGRNGKFCEVIQKNVSLCCNGVRHNVDDRLFFELTFEAYEDLYPPEIKEYKRDMKGSYVV